MINIYAKTYMIASRMDEVQVRDLSCSARASTPKSKPRRGKRRWINIAKL